MPEVNSVIKAHSCQVKQAWSPYNQKKPKGLQYNRNVQNDAKTRRFPIMSCQTQTTCKEIGTDFLSALNSSGHKRMR